MLDFMAAIFFLVYMFIIGYFHYKQSKYNADRWLNEIQKNKAKV